MQRIFTQDLKSLTCSLLCHPPYCSSLWKVWPDSVQAQALQKFSMLHNKQTTKAALFFHMKSTFLTLKATLNTGMTQNSSQIKVCHRVELEKYENSSHWHRLPQTQQFLKYLVCLLMGWPTKSNWRPAVRKQGGYWHRPRWQNNLWELLTTHNGRKISQCHHFPLSHGRNWVRQTRRQLDGPPRG